MIKRMRLQNIALITSAELDFSNGINVLSGETGAGKTVIISSLNFVLGAKADKTMIRRGEESCFIEAVFDVSKNYEVKNVLKEYDINCDEVELIIKRKLNVEGKNDIRVNGESVTLQMLKSITSLLCDVYGQSEHYSLLKESAQLKMIDLYCGEELQVKLDKIKEIIDEIKTTKEKLLSLGGDEKSRFDKIDLLTYQINEIETASLYEGEEEELLSKRKLYNNIEKIGEALKIVHLSITDDEGAVDRVNLASSKLSQISDYDKEYNALYERILSVKSEIEDIGYEAENLLDNLDYNEQEKQRVEERLDLYYNLKRKYGSDYNSIMEFYSKSTIELENLQNFTKLATEYETALNKCYSSLNKHYSEVSEIRKKYSKVFSQKIQEELTTLGMKDATFSVEISTNNSEDILSYKGIDSVTFYFSANKGEPLKTMSKVISGGEMSRFMLALKLVSSVVEEPITYIFDEIDAGISGEVAKIVAEKFALLSKQNQIITITHLPQIVSFSDKSFLIKKYSDEESTYTMVEELDYNGKVGEIVRIIGGSGETAILNAKEIIDKATKVKTDIRK